VQIVAFRIYYRAKVVLKTLSDPHADVSVRYVDKEKMSEFLNDKIKSPLGGLYVFTISQRGGVGIPWYVGKTEAPGESSLVREALHRDKLRKYARALAEEESGAARLYFLIPQRGNDGNIDDLETFLIWLARQQNPRLLNKRKFKLTPKELQDHFGRHRIAGVMNTGPGQPPNGAIRFRQMIGLDKKMFVVARE
jgi:hypothetical protein